MIDLKIISEVVANGLCTECGSCVGICPPVALEMRETPGGQVLPHLTESLCTECTLCDLICPEIEMSPLLELHLEKPMTGPVLAAYLADAVDTGVALEGQTGGLGRALLAFGLETGRIQGAVCVVDDPERPMRPKAIIARTPEEVLKASRSKYCPVPVNELLSEMTRFDGKLGYVGLSCHMQGLQMAMDRVKKLRKKVVLRVGLMCDRVLTYHAADFHARCATRGSSDEIVKFDYRSKEWNGWPGDIRVETRGDRVHNAKRTYRTGSKPLFTCTHCYLCPDKLNVLADVSLGDPHGVVQGHHVPTATIVRTDAGHEFLKAAEAAGRIRLAAADADEIARGQSIGQHVEDVQACGREMLHRGKPLPVFLQRGGLKVQKQRARPLWARLAIWWGFTSQQPWGIWVVRHVPRWVPLLRKARSRVWANVLRAGRVAHRLVTSGQLRPKQTSS
jgi:coenzyme F420 hydrogenase subunit beta